VWTGPSLRVARRYALPPLLGGLGLALAGRPWAAGVALAGAFGIALFFRDPSRAAAGDPGLVYAVTDGKVVLVREGVRVPWLPDGGYRQVSVFLSLADVHVARSPARGELLSWTWRDGRYLAANKHAAEQENRQGRLVIQTAGQPIGVVLTAGLIARRITRWVRPGPLGLGERLGIIHFGSRSVMYLRQDSYELLIGEGDRVRAGVTPVARRTRRPAP
jgi:phosphatidylserine decarboxylase